MAYYPPRPITPLAGEYTIYNRYISEYLSPKKNLSTLLVVVRPSSLNRAPLTQECNLNLVTTFVPVVLFG